MKAFICFALFAVVSAIPLQDAQVVVIPDGPVPIPVEMLRSGSFMPVWRDLPQVEDIPVPIPERNFRDFPNSIKISDVVFVNIADIPAIQAVYAEVPARDEIVPDAVNVVDGLLANDAEEVAPAAEEIVPDAVNVVDAWLANDDGEVASAAEEIVPNAVNVVDTLLANDGEEVAPAAEEIVPEPVNVVEYLEPTADLLAPELPASEDAEMRFVKFVDSPTTFDLKNMKVPIDAHDIV